MSPVLFVLTDGVGGVGSRVNKAAIWKVERVGYMGRMPAQQVTV